MKIVFVSTVTHRREPDKISYQAIQEEAPELCLLVHNHTELTINIYIYLYIPSSSLT